MEDYDYVYIGSRLVQMSVSTSRNGGTATEEVLNFAYDASGMPATVSYNDVIYYYITNLQGDVLAIVDGHGATLVEYEYDPYGRLRSTSGVMSTTLGEANPLRYRGYVYDTESRLYYLQSRYYDPKIGRFINADSLVSTGQGVLGYNMFAYCNNNPANLADHQGDSAAGVLNPNPMCSYSTIDDSGGGGGGAALIVAITEIGKTVGKLLTATFSIGAVIREYARVFIDSNAGRYANHQPRIHHVVPVGLFSHYGQGTMAQLIYMHDLFRSANISINDPENLLILSQGTHKSMHTPEYIDSIFQIMKQAKYGDAFSIRVQLLLARQYAASLDQYPNGY